MHACWVVCIGLLDRIEMFASASRWSWSSGADAVCHVSWTRLILSCQMGEGKDDSCRAGKV
jgi:hypothetical protein